MSNIIQMRRPAAAMLATIGLAAVFVIAQTPSPVSLRFTATTDKVAGAPDSIRIDIMRWSTDAERDQLLSAWNLTAPPATGGPGRAAAGVENDPALQDGGNPTPAAGGGGAGKGKGKGGAKGADAAVTRLLPEASLAAALGKAPTVGYLWSSEVAGYSLHYAVRLAEQNGGERIILITQRSLGAWNDLWKPVGPGTATSYEFSVIEIHLNSKGEGEGKVSLTGKVAVDSAGKTIALENYGALPVVLKTVRRRSPEGVQSK